MTDIILETLRAIVAGIALAALVQGQRAHEIRKVEGWHLVLGGFSLILFGCVIDITDNFQGLNRYMIVGDTPLQAFLEKVVGYLLGFMLLAFGVWRWLPQVIEHQKTISRELKAARNEVKILRGLLPICSSCKKIRDDKGYWYQLENYITEHSEARFSHGMCPECAQKLYATSS